MRIPKTTTTRSFRRLKTTTTRSFRILTWRMMPNTFYAHSVLCFAQSARWHSLLQYRAERHREHRCTFFSRDPHAEHARFSHMDAISRIDAHPMYIACTTLSHPMALQLIASFPPRILSTVSTRAGVCDSYGAAFDCIQCGPVGKKAGNRIRYAIS